MVSLLEDTVPLPLWETYWFSHEEFWLVFTGLISPCRSCHEVQQVCTDQKRKCHKDHSHWQAQEPSIEAVTTNRDSQASISALAAGLCVQQCRHDVVPGKRCSQARLRFGNQLAASVQTQPLRWLWFCSVSYLILFPWAYFSSWMI